MVYLVPITGCGRSGKTYIATKLGEYMVKNDIVGKCDIYDTSAVAKDFINSVQRGVGISSASIKDIDEKSDIYRNSLVDILHAIDRLGLRYESAIADIEEEIKKYSAEKFAPKSFDKRHLPYMIIINVREVNLIRDFGVYAYFRGFSFMPILVNRIDAGEKPNTIVDSQANFAEDFKNAGMQYYTFNNDTHASIADTDDAIENCARFITEHSVIVSNSGVISSNPRSVTIGSRWKHFKGEIVEVLNIATDTENGDELVIYKALSTGKTWARPMDMFLSFIDKEKYPDEYRDKHWRFNKML